MKHTQELRFINGGPARLLLVVEPASSEFWVDSRASVRLVVEGGAAAVPLEIEYLPGGMVIYLAQGSDIQVFQNGRRLAHGKQTRHMDAKLVRCKSGHAARVSPMVSKEERLLVGADAR